MGTATSSLFLRPNIAHRLGAVVQFVDHFTGLPVRIPLVVSIPAERWTAARSENDLTYRFLRTNQPIPTGIFDLLVECPTGEYESLEPVTLTLPVVVAHPPPVVRADYLFRFPLWPTRRLRPEAGETIVTGRLLQSGAPPTPAAGFRVRLFTPALPPVGTPYAYSNVNGEFVYRMPGLRMSISGGLAVTTATLNVEIRDAADAVVFAPTPASVLVRLGETNETTIEI